MSNTLLRILILALLSGLLISYPLWLSRHIFPQTPLIPGFDSTFLHFDKLLFGALLIMLLTIIVKPEWRKITFAALILFFLLLLIDLNRWQPWAFQYALMLFAFAVFPKDEKNLYNSLRIVVSGVYFWSGVQKFNEGFTEDIVPWMLEPLIKIFPSWESGLYTMAMLVPYLEIFISIGLFFSRTRTLAVIIAMGMHLFVLYDMSPIAKDYNYVIVPWNLAMMSFLFLLFYRKKEAVIPEHFKSIRTRIPAALLFLLFWIMPSFSFIDKWDSYLSARLYSGNSSNGYVFISEEVRQKLDPKVEKLIEVKDGMPYIYINGWSMEELGVPSYPEKKVYLKARNYFYKYCQDSTEVILMITDKYNLLDTNNREIIK
jgi:hypothetical protein